MITPASTDVESLSKTVPVIAASHLQDGVSHLFHFVKNGEKFEGFLIRHQGVIRAYLNLCPHAGEPLADKNQSAFNSDKRYLLCREHFALFDPETGKCVSGPCPIADLHKLSIIQEGEMICLAF
jgi:nitrite reductase/ring-hydroxylating ferredoxin subunit